jgi:hypothetical protein
MIHSIKVRKTNRSNNSKKVKRSKKSNKAVRKLIRNCNRENGRWDVSLRTCTFCEKK